MKIKQLEWAIDIPDQDVVLQADGFGGYYEIRSRTRETIYSAWFFHDNGEERKIGESDNSHDARALCQGHYKLTILRILDAHTEQS